MDGMKRYHIEVTCSEKNDSKSDIAGHKECAEISSRILLILNSLIFVWVFGHTLNTIHSHENENVGATMNLTTEQLTPNKEPALLFGYNADLMITNIASALAVAFSILAVIGVDKRSSNMLLIWFTSAIALFGLPFLVFSFVWESDVSFRDISFPPFLITGIYTFLDFILVGLTIRYYIEMVDEDSGVKNTVKLYMTIAVADPEYFRAIINLFISTFSKLHSLPKEQAVYSMTWREIRK